MNDTLPHLIAYLAYISPMIIALLWANLTSLGSVKRLMLYYAKAHFAGISFVFLYSFVIGSLCDGSSLKGYVRCAIVPLEIANLTFAILFVVLAALVTFALVAVLWCGVLELRKSKAPQH